MMLHLRNFLWHLIKMINMMMYFMIILMCMQFMITIICFHTQTIMIDHLHIKFLRSTH